MSAEPSARVTDEAVQHIVVHGRVPTGGLATQYEIRLANALAEERLCTANLDTMGRATEAKLTAALAEVERLTADADEAIAGLSDARDQYRRASHENHQRATAAESALAATKAKLEALERVIGFVESWVANRVSVYSVAALDGMFAMTRDRIAALTTQETDHGR